MAGTSLDRLNNRWNQPVPVGKSTFDFTKHFSIFSHARFRQAVAQLRRPGGEEMKVDEYLQGIAEQLVHELEPILSIKEVTANSDLLGAYTETTVRRLIGRVVHPMRVSTGAVIDYPMPEMLRQLDAIVWAPFPAPGIFDIDGFALVPRSSAFGLLEIKRSANIDSIAYLHRARQRLDQHTREALFYAALELRCGTESRLQDYLDARKDIAKHKKQGWKIVGSAKELDRLLRLGDTIFEGSFLDRDGSVVLAVYYTPVTARLRESAGARLHDLLHAMKMPFEDDDRWWADTRSFLEQIYSDLAFANKGTLLAPIMRSPDGKSFHMSVCVRDDSPIADKVHLFSHPGSNVTIRVRYLKSLPDYAMPFLNRTDA